jgi:hypothetical protein
LTAAGMTGDDDIVARGASDHGLVRVQPDSDWTRPRMRSNGISTVAPSIAAATRYRISR